jgi:hypothetical protein
LSLDVENSEICWSTIPGFKAEIKLISLLLSLPFSDGVGNNISSV